MTVLNLGANIGYYSVLASKLVGKTGRVFAFEPCFETFSLLRKNIEANGLKNIMPVAKAVSNQCGKQILYLADDCGEHSLIRNDSCKSTEVDVTTVDEFVKNMPVDIVLMDVEGSELNVLEGMDNTIRNNPNIKIITEYCPLHLQRNGSTPSAFLDKIISYGFKMCVVKDEHIKTGSSHTRELMTKDGIINFCQNINHVNIYCTRCGV